MTLDHLLNAIEECNEGQLSFNKGKKLRSFLFKRHWYPLRACVNRALSLNGENAKTTDGAVAQELLVSLGLWARISLVNNQTNGPIPLSSLEIEKEVKSLSNVLYKLTN